MRPGAPIPLAVADLLSHVVERLGRPGHHVERVGAQGGVGTALTNHGRDPFGGVARNQPHQARPLFTEQVEERLESGLVPTRGRPDEPSAVVVDHHGQVLVAPAATDLADADATPRVFVWTRGGGAR
jgi:hypothetical protein